MVGNGSDAAATRCFYGRLIFCGPLGLIAINLFRAQKCSARAKQYRGGIRGVGSYKVLAYQRKEWSLASLYLLLGVCEAAARLPPESLEALLDLISEPGEARKASKR